MKTEPVILCIETSSSICSIALCNHTEILSERISDEPNGHSRMLATMIQQLMIKSGVQFQDLSAVAVSAGPGSYTGLRIGMSTAKGICYAAEKPLISISTFDAMVTSYLRQSGSLPTDDLLLPMVDARRMEVYTRLYNHKGVALDNQKNFIAGESSFFDVTPKGTVHLFGSGAEKMQTAFDGCKVICDNRSYISAVNLRVQAFKKWDVSQFEDVAYAIPNYGKDWQPGK